MTTLNLVLDMLQQLELSDEAINDSEIEVRTLNCGTFSVATVGYQNGKVVLFVD